jgi:hypothetical protein
MKSTLLIGVQGVLKSLLVFLIGWLFTINILGNDYWVTSTADSGPGTLREAVGFANSNLGQDSIFFDVRGEIVVNSSIAIGADDLVIIGPGSRNVLIKSTSSDIFSIATGGGILKISGLTFSSSNGSALFFDGGHVELYDCIFRNCQANGNGAAIRMQNLANFLSIDNCSFVDNRSQGTGLGGSIYSVTGDVYIHNSTFGNSISFSGNNAVNGGALYLNNIGGQIVLMNNTFARNNVGAGQGGAVWLNNSSSFNVRIINNLFYQNVGGTPTQDLFSQVNLPIDPALRNYNNFGGTTTNNNYSAASNDFWGATGANQWYTWIQSGGNGTLYLTETGRGHFILNITDPLAPFVDNGDINAFYSYSTDVRGAPRTLQGFSIFQIDRGAMEFSPFRVYASAGIGSLEDVLSNVNSSTFSQPFYVWFDVPTTPVQINLSNIGLSATAGSVIIDGFSQRGARTGYKSYPAVWQVILDGSTNSASKAIELLGDFSELRGVVARNTSGAGEAIVLSGLGNKIEGCYLHNVNNIAIGVHSDNNYIGGPDYIQRNYIGNLSGSNSKAIHLDYASTNNYNYILNNFIGVDTLLASAPLDYGIVIENADYTNVGGYDNRSANFISSCAKVGIRVFNDVLMGQTNIKNNYLGVRPDFTQHVGYATTVGIEIIGEQYTYLGSMLPSGNVITASDTAIRIIGGIGTQVEGNIIGLYPDGVTDGYISNAGIYIGGASSDVFIGTYGDAPGNVIGGYDQIGIHVNTDAGSWTTYILGNYIGTDITGNVAKNIGNIGVLVDGLSENTLASVQNNYLVSGSASSSAILVDSSSPSVGDNKIGYYRNGSVVPSSFEKGVVVNNMLVNSYGDVSYNKIEGMSFNGIELNNTRNLNVIGNNVLNSGNIGVFIQNSDTIQMYLDTITGSQQGGIVTQGSTLISFERTIAYNNGACCYDFDINNNGYSSAHYPITENFNIVEPVINNANYCEGQLTLSFSVNGWTNFADSDVQLEFYVVPSTAHSSNRGGTFRFIGQAYFFLDASGNYSGSETFFDTFNVGDLVTAVLLNPFDEMSPRVSSEFALNVPIESNLSISVSATQPACAGDLGSATATVVGSANSPSWFLAADMSNALFSGMVFSDIPPDNYAVVINEGTCADTAYFSITAPSAVTVTSPVLGNIGCAGLNDGFIDFGTVSGGTPSYEYSIDDGLSYFPTTFFSSLTAGTYLLRVRDINGCMDSLTVTLSEPTALFSFMTVTDLTCYQSNDGSILSNPSGGTPPYTFSWTGPGKLHNSKYFWHTGWQLYAHHH